MKHEFRPQMYAIDFGTSNSLLAAANESGVHGPIALDPGSSDPSILRSILYFPSGTACFFGQGALDEYIARGMQGRLVRSIKRFLPVRSFGATQIGSLKVTLEDLIGRFLSEMRARANAYFEADVDVVMLGRPALFSQDLGDDAYAQERLERAAHTAGFREVHFCPEPVAAAHAFRRGITTPKTVLVADFGGGTSDFTVMKMRPDGFEVADVLAIGGLTVAGDALDGALMRRRISSHFGADVTYKVPMGSNVLSMPRHLLEKLCSPPDLCLLQQRDVQAFLRDVRSWSLGASDKERIDQLLSIIDDALGFQIFEAIELTKRSLSRDESAVFRFEYPSIDIEETISRADFEAACERELSSILDVLDQTVKSAGVAPADIDVVCCTGGTARVTSIARAIESRFGAARVQQMSSFHSVIEGLAERAHAMLA